MHLAQLFTLALAAAVASTANAYVIRTYPGPNCTGQGRNINVWDNTCRNQEVPETRSFRVLTLGAHLQWADFYRTLACVLPAEETFEADGRSDRFQMGECLTLPFTAVTFGSRSG